MVNNIHLLSLINVLETDERSWSVSTNSPLWKHFSFFADRFSWMRTDFSLWYSLYVDLGVLWIASKNVFFKLDRFWEFFFREKSGTTLNYWCYWESSLKMFIALKTWIQCMYNCPQQVPLTFHTCLVLCMLSHRTSEIVPHGCLHQIL